MAGGAAEVDETAFGEHEDGVAFGEGVFIHLRFDFHPDGVGIVQTVDLNFAVEVADVADDRLILHVAHVFEGDHREVAGGGDIDVATAQGFLDGGDFVAFHGGLEGVDGVDFGHDDAGAEAAEGLGGTFADVAITADDADFAGDHDVGGALDAIGQGFAAAVEVVELRLGDGVVDVDGRNEQGARFVHLIEAVNAGGGLFGDAAPAFDDRVPAVGGFGVNLLQEVFDDLLFFVAGGGVDPVGAVFEFVAFVDEEGGVAAVVDDQFGSEAARVRERLVGAPPVFFQRLAFPGEDGDARGGDGGGGVVLRGEDVAARPANAGAEVDQRFNQNGGLNGHVQRTGDANAGERLAFRVLFPDRHEAGHFLFGDGDFFAAPVGQFHIGDFKVGGECCCAQAFLLVSINPDMLI